MDFDPDRSRPAAEKTEQELIDQRLRAIGESHEMQMLAETTLKNGVHTTTLFCLGTIDAISTWLSVNHGPEKAAEILFAACDAASLRVAKHSARDAAVRGKR